MNSVNCQMRRATIDDLEALRALWTQAAAPVAALERSLTEFQVAQAADGTLLACIGLQLDAQQGKIHHPCYRSPELRLTLAQPLWERLQSVARNHGLWRLWTQDQNPVWRERGFQNTDEGVLKKLPARFAGSEGDWLVLKLRDEVTATISFEREFELFKQSQQDWTKKALRQARVLRVLAFLVAMVMLSVAGWMLWRFMKRWPMLTKP